MSVVGYAFVLVSCDYVCVCLDCLCLCLFVTAVIVLLVFGALCLFVCCLPSGVLWFACCAVLAYVFVLVVS